LFRTGDPRLTDFRRGSAAVRSPSCLFVVDNDNGSNGACGGNLAAIRICLTGDGILGASPPLPDRSNPSCTWLSDKTYLDALFGFFGVFQFGLIRQSGSIPSFLARARVIRRGGDAIFR
jgi:hypothetical protein